MTQTFSRPDPFAGEHNEPSQMAAGGFGANPGTGAPETLYEMAQALLDIVRAAAVTRGIALPERQLVYPSPIPADCEQVAVLFTGWNPTPMPSPDGTTLCHMWRWVAPFSAIITRCTPAVLGKGKALRQVTPDQMLAAARIASDDSEVLLEAMNGIGEVGADVSVAANPPSGGFQTVELNVSLISGGSFL
jgi:hypothetical protein